MMSTTAQTPSPIEPEPAWEVALLFPSQGEWTEDDYLSLTDSTNYLVEFEDGRIEVLQMPTERHQLIVQFLFLALHRFVSSQELGTVLFAPFRVRTRPARFREPDVVFMLAEHNHRRDDRFWAGADLVLEVVSEDPKSRDRDLRIKRLEYAQSGISEYWIVDPLENQITVLRLEGSEYALHGTFGLGQEATSALLNGFAVDVSGVFHAGKTE